MFHKKDSYSRRAVRGTGKLIRDVVIVGDEEQGKPPDPKQLKKNQARKKDQDYKAAVKAAKAAGKEIPERNEAEARDPEPIDFQCILLERVHSLAAHHQGLLKANPPVSSYKYSTIVTDPQKDPGTVMSRIQHGGKTDEVKEILSLCPDVHGLLSPYIKVSRVEYDMKTKKPTGVEKPLRIPNFLSPDDVSKILSGKLGRSGGAGIKSFKWELKGVQPADVDNNITATLVLYFQSIGDFFAEASDAAGNAQGGLKEPTFLDLIINSPGIRQKKKKTGSPPSKPKCGADDSSLHRGYEGDAYRIKVCAGWAAPPNLKNIYPALNKTAKGAQKPRYDVLYEAIRATRVSLFLQMVKHDISFNQNGSLTLTVDYQAALSGLATAPNSNILIAGSGESNIVTKREEIKRLEKEALLNDEEEPDTETLLEDIDKLEQADRKEKYDKLLKGVYGSNKIYSIKVPIEQIVIPKLSKLPFPERQKLAQQRSNAIDDGSAAPTSVLGAQKNYVESASGEEHKESFTARLEEQKDEVTISYIYLGDLLDTILAQLPGGQPPPFGFFLSEVEVIDMLRAARFSKIKNVLACRDPAGSDYLKDLIKGGMTDGVNLKKLYKKINIGDIPISLDAFQAFFLKNVVDKQRDKYYFLKFVKDICSKLITNALRSKCYGPDFKFANRFDVQPLSLYETDFAGSAAVGAIAQAKSQLGCHINDASKFGSALILISTDSKGSGLKGVFDDDVKKGIYHHYIGSACSLIKTLDFQREDQPYLREARLQKEGALGAEQLRELYSVNIKLVGNNLYRNGSLIYVSPLLINTTKEQLNYLGLHGYYLVTSVSSEITESSFTTSIRALQEGIEFPDSGDGNTTPPAPEKSNADNPKLTEAEEHALKEMEAGQSIPPTSNEASTPVTEETPGESAPSEGTAKERAQRHMARRETEGVRTDPNSSIQPTAAQRQGALRQAGERAEEKAARGEKLNAYESRLLLAKRKRDSMDSPGASRDGS